MEDLYRSLTSSHGLGHLSSSLPVLVKESPESPWRGCSPTVHDPGPCRSSGEVVLTLGIRSPRRTRSSLDKRGDDEVTVEPPRFFRPSRWKLHRAVPRTITHRARQHHNSGQKRGRRRVFSLAPDWVVEAQWRRRGTCLFHAL